ncbi:helix-turn-helix domain-containing protein, partial [Alicyclobacillus shizuokensis]|uniref:helix-turn-helix domain-containing protein n=1 Tax=Alicyclobacillus shizuokensis TaxID=392014 RepID=UPI000AF8D8B0
MQGQTPADGQEPALRSLTTALRVLQCFSMEEPELGVTEIALRLGVGKSTVHRILTTLERNGFVRKDEATRRYRL